MTTRMYLISAITLLNIISYFIAIVTGETSFSLENGILENMQATLVLLAAMVGLLYTRHKDPFLRLTGLYFAVLGLSIFLREVDIERLHYNLPKILVWLGHGVGRNTLLAILFITLFWRTIQLWRRTIRPYFSQLILSSTAILMASSLALLLVGDLFERNIFGTHNHVFYEEMIELNAYLLFLAAAITAKLSIYRIKSYKSLRLSCHYAKTI